MTFISRGFRRREEADAPSNRVPPGQYVTHDFPVLSAGPTPRIGLDEWRLEVVGKVAQPRAWGWQEFTSLPAEDVTVDIHCVTKWSKLDTKWHGVSLDTFLDGVETGGRLRHGALVRRLHDEPAARGPDRRQGVDRVRVRRRAARARARRPGAPAGAPPLLLEEREMGARRSSCATTDAPGFWEGYGYHNYGDPWREQRYSGD